MTHFSFDIHLENPSLCFFASALLLVAMPTSGELDQLRGLLGQNRCHLASRGDTATHHRRRNQTCYRYSCNAARRIHLKRAALPVERLHELWRVVSHHANLSNKRGLPPDRQLPVRHTPKPCHQNFCTSLHHDMHSPII